MSRSFLFVPGDSERKLEKAVESNADALIIDLEDSVASSQRPEARKIAREFISGRSDLDLWVRINSLDTEDALADLRELMPAGPVGIVLPKPRSAKDAIQLAKLLDVFEQENDLQQGRTMILPVLRRWPRPWRPPRPRVLFAEPSISIDRS